MRNVPQALMDHLGQQTTTVSKCWRITCRDGKVFGFTEHDQNLTFDGIQHAAKSGGELSFGAASADLSTDHGQFDATLDNDMLLEEDLLNGKFDHADFEIWLVNWQDLDQRVLLNKGYIGEIQHTPNGFQAEFRGVAHQLNRQIGRLYQKKCDAELGDPRCKISLPHPDYTEQTSIIMHLNTHRIIVASLSILTAAELKNGRLHITNGPFAVQVKTIRSARNLAAGTEITLWEKFPIGDLVSTLVEVTIGCDKTMATCVERFSNILNFRGFPHMPGNDFVLQVPGKGEGHEGGQRT